MDNFSSPDEVVKLTLKDNAISSLNMSLSYYQKVHNGFDSKENIKKSLIFLAHAIELVFKFLLQMTDESLIFKKVSKGNSSKNNTITFNTSIKNIRKVYGFKKNESEAIVNLKELRNELMHGHFEKRSSVCKVTICKSLYELNLIYSGIMDKPLYRNVEDELQDFYLEIVDDHEAKLELAENLVEQDKIVVHKFNYQESYIENSVCDCPDCGNQTLVLYLDAEDKPDCYCCTFCKHDEGWDDCDHCCSVFPKYLLDEFNDGFYLCEACYHMLFKNV